MNRFKYIFDHSKVGMAICNAKDNSLGLVNQAFARIHGYEPEELIGVEPGKVFAPECMQRLSEYENFSSPTCTLGDISFEATHIKKDGSVVEVSVNITVVRDENGNPKHRIVNIQDVSGRKAEEETNNFQHFAFENIHDAIFVVNEEAKIIHVNEEASRYLGYTKAELLNMSVMDFDPGFPRERWATHWNDIKTQKTLLFETKHKRKDGSMLPVEINVSYFEYDGNGHGMASVRDISERKEYEKAIKEAGERYAQIFDNSLDGIYLLEVTPDGRFLHLETNPAYIKASGLPKEVFVGRYVDEIEDDAIRNTLTKKYQACINAGTKIEYLSEFDLPAGHRIFHSMLTPIKDEDGRIYRIVGIARDITNAKEEEEKLKQSEQQFRRIQSKLSAFISTIPDLVWLKDENGVYITCNVAFEKLFNVEASNIIGKSDYDFFKTEEADICRKTDTEAIAAKTVCISEESVYNPENDSMTILEVRKAPVYQPDGTLLGVMGIGRDISEKRVVEKALRAKEREFRGLAENSPDVIVRYDKELKRTYVNSAWERANGIPVSEVLGKSPTELSVRVASTAKEYSDKLKKTMETGESTQIDIIWADKQGKDTFYDLRAVAEYDENGEVCGVLTVSRDVTKAKNMADALEQREREFRTLSEHSPNIIMRYDANCRRTYVNPAYSKETGIPVETATSATPSEQWSKYLTNMNMDAAEYQANLKQVFKSGKPMEFLVDWNRVSDDKYVAHNIHMVPEFDASGNVAGVLAIGHNITEQKLTQEKLEAREEEFRALVEHTPDTVARYDKDCVRLYTNPAFAKATGMTQEELNGRKPSSYNPSEQATAYERTIQGVFESGEEADVEYSWPDKTGHILTSHIRIVPEKNKNGETVSVVATGRDITKLKEYENELKQNEMKLKEAQKIAKVGSWELLFPELDLVWSDELYRIFEIDKSEGNHSYKHFLDLVHPDERLHVDAHYHESLTKKTPYDIVHRILMPDGRIKYIHQRGKTLYDEVTDAPIRSIGTVQDITEQKLIEKKIEFLAYHDPLTGLPNRILARDRTEQIIAKSKRNGTKSALLFIDLDDFKTINDSLGHLVGDSMLNLVASRLRENTREMDTISRLGGDEFLVILGDIHSVDDVSAATEKLLAGFDKPFSLGLRTLSSSISIGIAMYPDDGDNFDTLLQKADTAMYQAKEAGRNSYCFFAEQMNSEIMEHLRIQNDLKKAIEQNEFVLHYQPQIDLHSNTVTGAEALIRWNHPERGMVPPMSFIPIAESSGLIVRIGEWVIKEACHQAAQWSKKGIHLTMAVNISAIQFKRGNLEEVVRQALDESGLNPQLLELELTESILIHDTEKVLQAVKRLKAMGMQLSIDDFGTGYSSLSYLKRFAVDKLKIDQSFVRDMLNDQEDAAIVRAVIQMAKSLNLKTIAEGVENIEVLNIINGYGCDEVQGYHFAKPLEAVNFEQYYKGMQEQKGRS
jgi:diguanylate cyclase (GGDEF)-like protein/PAS domain S-box-containing protein